LKKIPVPKINNSTVRDLTFMYEKIKKRTYEVLEQASRGDRLSKIVDVFIISLIIFNIACVILETEGSLQLTYLTYLTQLYWPLAAGGFGILLLGFGHDRFG
jgi:hypothetical protein